MTNKVSKYVNTSIGSGLVLFVLTGLTGELQLATIGGICIVFGFGIAIGADAAKDE